MASHRGNLVAKGQEELKDANPEVERCEPQGEGRKKADEDNEEDI